MQKYFIEARQLLALAIPVVLAQFAQSAIGFVDTVMAGSFSATDMAAVAVGTSIWLPVILLGHGILLALTPTVAQFNGSNRRGKIGSYVQQTFWMAGFLSIGVIFIIWFAGLMINKMPNIDQQMALTARHYMHALMWGAPGYLFFQVLRNQCEGLSKTKPGMIMGFLALAINIPLNFLLIFGHIGLPKLGGVGCGVATALVYWIMFLIMRFWVARMPEMHDIYDEPRVSGPDRQILKRIFTLGLPLACALFFEVTLFALVALLVSPLGIVDVASHQIALNFSSLMFVLPLSMGVAVTIRIGYRLGQGSVEQAKVAAWTAQGVGICLVLITATTTVVFRHSIARLYNDDPAVVTLAAHLMSLAAIYQFSDSLQVVGSGILRGYKDTKAIFFITLLSYWVLGLPCGYILALTDYVLPAMGPAGFWCGFIIGLTAAAIMMIYRIVRLQRRPAQELLERSSH